MKPAPVLRLARLDPIFFLLLLPLLIFSTAQAAPNANRSKIYCGSIPSQQFPFPAGTQVTLSQFDGPALGFPGAVLSSVTISATLNVSQTFGFENSSTNVTGTIDGNGFANLKVFSPNKTTGNGLFQVATQTTNLTANLGVYDGLTDYTGTSGVTFPTQNSSNSGSLADTPTAPYVGSGTVNFPVKAGLIGFDNSSGNLANAFTFVSTTAAVDLCVTYDFQFPTAVGLSWFSAQSGPNGWMGWGAIGMLFTTVMGLARISIK